MAVVSRMSEQVKYYHSIDTIPVLVESSSMASGLTELALSIIAFFTFVLS